MNEQLRMDLTAVAAAGLFIMLFSSIVSIDPRPAFQGEAPRVQVFRGWDAAPEGQEEPVEVARFMFGPYAVPLIVLSTVLLVALVAALFLAKPEQTEDERP